MQHPVGDAAEQHGVGLPPAATAQHDQLGLQLGGGPHDLVGGRTLAHHHLHLGDELAQAVGGSDGGLLRGLLGKVG